MSASIPLPALDVRPPQPQQNPLEEYGRLVQLKSLMQGQQLQQQQIQLGQQTLRDQQATTEAWRNWDPKQNSYDDLAKDVVNRGGSAGAAMAVTQHGLQVQQAVQTLTKDQRDNLIQNDKLIGDRVSAALSGPDAGLQDRLTGVVNDLTKNKTIDPQGAQSLLQQVQSTSDPTQLRTMADLYAKQHSGFAVVAAQQKEAAETEEAKAKTRVSNADAAMKEIEAAGLQGLTPELAKKQINGVFDPSDNNPTVVGQNRLLTSQVLGALARGDRMTAKKYLDEGFQSALGAQKEEQVAQATQPLKIQTAQAEAATRMAMEGMAKPVYAYDPTTNTTKLYNQTEALHAGLKAIRPVTEKDVRDDTMLSNRLADVHQKLAEYEQSLQQPVSSKDQGNMAALLGTEKTILGMHFPLKVDIPMERLDAALQKENLSKLSAPARDQLVAYRNVREAMLGYKTVLAGSARGSDKSLDLLTQAMPDPSITDPDFSQRSIGAFKQNLHIVGQGLPELPGIKTPRQVESEVWGSQGLNGGTVKMKAPDGTIKPVPSNQVEHYKSLGATVVQ